MKRWYLLGLFDGLSHGQEDAVEQNGRHDEIVEVLVSGKVDAGLPCPAPWTEQEERVGCGETMDVILPKSLRHHAKRLKENDESKINGVFNY